MRYYDDAPMPDGPLCCRCGKAPADTGCWWCNTCDEEWGESTERLRMFEDWNKHPPEAQRYRHESMLRFTNNARRKRGDRALMLGYRP